MRLSEVDMSQNRSLTLVVIQWRGGPCGLVRRLVVSHTFQGFLQEKFFPEIGENRTKWGTNIVPKSRWRICLEARAKAITTIDSRSEAFAAANIAETKKGVGTLVLDVRQVTLLADYFVIVGGESVAQVKAIVDAIDDGLSELGHPPRSVEGKKDGRWVLLDFGDVIVHVLHIRERNYYKLEQFWNQALIVDREEWLEV